MRPAVRAAAFLILLMLPLHAQEREPYTVSVDVDLVILNVRVLDKSGQPVAGLSKEDFRVEEDGRPQPITLFIGEDNPATIGLAVDSSGSINSKQDEIEAAAIRFVESSHPQDEFFIVRFNDKIHWSLPHGMSFTDDVTILKQALSRREVGGRTALFDAIGAALDRMMESRWDKRALIVLSDGGDNASARTLEETVRLAQQSDVTIYTIGMFDELAADANPEILSKLARVTGGTSYTPRTLEELRPAWEHIAEGIRSQYTIGYRPSAGALDGRYHKIRVRVDQKGSKLRIHTRPGYLARKADGER